MVVGAVLAGLVAPPAGSVDATRTPSSEAVARPSPAEVPLLTGGSPRPSQPVVPPGQFPSSEALPAGVPAGSRRLDLLTTETGEAYLSPDGRVRQVLSPAPVRVRTATGAWEPVDLSLVPGPDGDLRPVRAAYDVVATSPDRGLLRHSTAAGPIVMGHPLRDRNGAARNAERSVESSQTAVRVRDAAQRLESTLTWTLTGVEHDFIWRDRASAQPSLLVPFALPAGVTASLGESGVRFELSDGAVIAEYGGGLAYDASGAETSVTVTLLETAAGRALVDVAVDGDWLADPSRAFPVVVDPLYRTIRTGDAGSADTFVQSDLTSSQYAASELRVGRATDGSVARSLLYFDLGDLRTRYKYVDAATLTLYSAPPVGVDGTGCSNTSLDVFQPSGTFGPETTWATQPGAEPSTPSAGTRVTFTTTAGDTDCNNISVAVNVHPLMYHWHRGSLPYRGVGLMATDEASSERRRFQSAEGATTPAYAPTLTVEVRDEGQAQPVYPADGAVLAASPTRLQATAEWTLTEWMFSVYASEPVAGNPTPPVVASSGSINSNTWTLPPGLLAPGTYYWVATHSGGGSFATFGQPVRFTVRSRLGTGGPSPMDQAGPVAVNLATGNAVVSVASPTVSTVGGPVGLRYTHNSSQARVPGLAAAFYADTDLDRNIDDGELVATRMDANVEFSWPGVPHPGVPSDNFMVRWTGRIQFPAGTWSIFGNSFYDGYRVWVDGAEVISAWRDTSPYQESSAYSFTGGGPPKSFELEFIDDSEHASITLWAYSASTGMFPIPPSWFVPAEPGLPAGWTPSVDLGGGLAVFGARVEAAKVVLLGSDGSTYDFMRSGSSNGFSPPPGHDGTLVTLEDGTLQFSDGAGGLYLFDGSGQLLTYQSGADDRRPAAPRYTYTNGRLASVVDRVSGATLLTLAYGSPCPTGLLCTVTWPDTTTSTFSYENGLLKRITDPGGVITEFGYDASGRITRVRQPFGFDLATYLVSELDGACDQTCTKLTYDTSGRVSSVVAPDPLTGALRPTTTYAYGTGTTDVVVAGAVGAAGFSRRVAFDDSGRLLTDTDATGVMTRRQGWIDRARDLVIWTKDAAGVQSSTTYDHANRPVDRWGPAADALIDDANGLPTVAGVPLHRVTYDGGITGLAATYWDRAAPVGQEPRPRVHDTGVGDPAGGIARNWGTAAPISGIPADNWQLQLTGEITFPSPGDWVLSPDGAQLWGWVRIYVDDVPVSSRWYGESYDNTIAIPDTQPHRLRIDFVDPGPSGTNAQLPALRWSGPGVAWPTTVPASAFAPRYGLVTRTQDPDGRVSNTGYSDANGVGPHHGLPVSTTVDPGGLNLVTATAYETPGTGHFLRRTTRTLPAGNSWSYAYYGADAVPATAAPPSGCGGGIAADQRGALQSTFGPDPDGAGPTGRRIDETIHDIWGRAIAHRSGTSTTTSLGSTPWTCTTYDSRGRVASVSHPAFGAEPVRTVTTNYAVGGDPRVTSIADPAGTVVTTVDGLGRVISYRDVWNTVTTYGYDQAGRRLTASGPAGNVGWSYDPAGRLLAQTLGGATLATVTYDSIGRMATASYPTGTGTAGNGTSGTFSYDSLGRQASVTWSQAGGALLTSNAVTSRSPGGVVLDQTIDGVDPYTAGPNFQYDNAGRLTSARVPGQSLVYGFAASGGCGALTTAGANTNRTSASVNGATATTYCYDHADRLTSTTATGIGTIRYDSHGNTTLIAGETHGYDNADRHLQTTKSSTTVRYVRDALDRIVERQLNGTVVARYGHSLDGDTPTVTFNSAGAVIEAVLSLPGGALYTDNRNGGTDRWSYPNLHGDLVGVASATGAKLGSTTHYDPYGQRVSGSIPDNLPGSFDYGWLGQHQRPLEQQSGLQPIIEMGARQYSPLLGRFLEVDPVSGGCANDYVYVSDPVNDRDLAGTRCPGPIQRIVSFFGARSFLTAADRFRRQDYSGAVQALFEAAPTYGQQAGGYTWRRLASIAEGTVGRAATVASRLFRVTFGIPVTIVATLADYACGALFNDHIELAPGVVPRRSA